MDFKSMIKKISESSTSGGGNYIQPGRGRLIVKKLALESGFNGDRFIAEFIVKASSKIPVVSLSTGETLNTAPNPPGTEVSWIQMFKHDSAWGNIKDFFLSLYSESESSVTMEDLGNAIEEAVQSNGARGMAIDFTTYQKVTKANKQEITIPKWAAVEQEAADIKDNRRWMDSIILANSFDGSAPQVEA